MVFVIDGDERRRDVCEAILAKLRFAVAPFESSESAIAVMSSLRPEVVVAGSVDYTRLRDPLQAVSTTQGIPLVEILDGGTHDAVVDAIRAAIRTTNGTH